MISLVSRFELLCVQRARNNPSNCREKKWFAGQNRGFAGRIGCRDALKFEAA
jgi:hypothetical protein